MSFAKIYKAILPYSSFFLVLLSLYHKKIIIWACYDDKQAFMNDLDFRLLEAERVSYSGSLLPGKNKKSLCLTSCV